MKLKKNACIVLASLLAWGACFVSFAQPENPDAQPLFKKITAAANYGEASEALEQLVVFFDGTGRFDELYDYLKSLEKEKLNKTFALLL